MINLQKTTDNAFPAYLECALWSISDDDGYLDENHNIGDIHRDTRRALLADLQRIIAAADKLTPDWRDYWSVEQFGHDFWLTRNGHGAGFWDQYSDGRGDEIGEILTRLSGFLGEVDLYIGDHGYIYA